MVGYIGKRKAPRAKIPDSRLLKATETEILRGDSFYAISRLKESKNSKLIKSFINKHSDENNYCKILFGTTFPPSYTDISQYRATYKLDLYSELIWNACIINHHSNFIHEFENEKNKLSKHFLSINSLDSDYKVADKILDKILDKFGYSYWYIENKINYLQSYFGLKQQKDFKNLICNNDNSDPIVILIALFSSIRAELSISSDALITLIDSIEIENDELISFLYYQLGIIEKVDLKHLNAIMWHSGNASIIDRYNTLIKICQIIYSHNNILKLNKLKNIISQLDNIQTDSVQKLRLLTGEIENNCIPHNNKLINLIDAYTLGNYKKSFEEANLLITTQPDCLESVEINIKSIARLDELKDKRDKNDKEIILIEAIQEHFFNLLIKSSDAYSSYYALRKIALLYFSYDWSLYILYFIENYYKEKHTDKILFLDRLSCTVMNISNPRFFIRTLPYSISKTDIQKITSPTLLGYLSEYFNDFSIVESTNIPKHRLARIKAKLLINNSDINNAIFILEEYINYSDNIVNEDIKLDLIHCYIVNNKLDTPLELLIDSYINNGNCHVRFPYDHFFNKLDDCNDSDIWSSINTSISYDIYCKHVSNNLEIKRSQSLEYFLELHNIKKPSDLKAIIDDIVCSEEKLLYFLRNIAITSIFDSLTAFSSTEELMLERISICQWLNEIDTDNTDEYDIEIKELTQKIEINRALINIERSKIYVDIEGIKNNSLDKSVKAYKRYLEFKQLEHENQGILNNLLLKIEEENFLIKLGADQSLGILTVLIEDIFSKFLSSNEYGLDGYLSVGIRHGALTGHLRRHLDKNHLLNKKIKKNVYKDNEYWLEKYSGFTRAVKKEMNNIFITFSEKVDDITANLKNNLLQINYKNKNKNGLFDYNLNEYDLALIDNQLSYNTTHAEFFNILVNYFWSKTDIILSNIRYKIEQEIKVEYDCAFVHMLKSLNELAKTNNLNIDELLTIINTSKIEFQNELKKISNWFTRVEYKHIDKISLDDLVEMSIDMVKNINPTSNINITVHNELHEIFINGKSIRYISEILFNVFENIIDHSKLPLDNIEATVKIKKVDNILNIETINKYGQDFDSTSLGTIVDVVKYDIDNISNSKKMTQEGGTGLVKISKYLINDLKSYKPIIKSNSETFCIIIPLNMENVCYENTSI